MRLLRLINNGTSNTLCLETQAFSFKGTADYFRISGRNHRQRITFGRQRSCFLQRKTKNRRYVLGWKCGNLSPVIRLVAPRTRPGNKRLSGDPAGSYGNRLRNQKNRRTPDPPTQTGMPGSRKATLRRAESIPDHSPLSQNTRKPAANNRSFLVDCTPTRTLRAENRENIRTAGTV